MFKLSLRQWVFFLAAVLLFAAAFWIYLNPLILWNVQSRFFSKSCDYPAGCSGGEICVQKVPGQAACFENPTEAVSIPFPVAVSTPVICTQGPLTAAERTHSYLNTAFAVDLATHAFYPDAEVRAVFSGEVVVHRGCSNWDEAEFSNDTCGQGFGNWVALFDDDSDHIAFYAHLRKVFVNTGDFVESGQSLGQEGKSGAAGHRHLHFSVHRNIWKLSPAEMQKNGAWLPPSVPYTTRIALETGEGAEVHVTQLPCEDNNDLTRDPFFGSL